MSSRGSFFWDFMAGLIKNIQKCCLSSRQASIRFVFARVKIEFPINNSSRRLKMAIPDEVLAKGMTNQVSTPLEIHYNPDTKQLRVTYYQGVMSDERAFPIHLEFDASSSKQLIVAAVGLAQELGIDVAEETTTTYF